MWFHKKKVDAPAALPQLPHFPSTPASPEHAELVAQYTQTFEQPQKPAPPLPLPKIEMPQAVMAPPPEIPKREPLFIQKKIYPEREGQAPQPLFPEQPRAVRSFEETDEHGLPQRVAQGLATKEQGFTMPQQAPVQPRFTPAEPRLISVDQQQRPAEERPVFVKLEQYREVIAHLDVLKQKIKETEYFIDRIEELRAQEQAELENCQSNLNKLKEKLLAIDKKLFEV